VVLVLWSLDHRGGIVKVKVILRPTDCRSVRLGIRQPPRTCDQFFTISNFFYSFGFIDVVRPLWREVGSVLSVFTGHRQRSLSQIWVPRDSWACFIVSIFETPPIRRARFLFNFISFIQHSTDPIGSTFSCGCGNCLNYKNSTEHSLS
jgi:hypothetical protein